MLKNFVKDTLTEEELFTISNATSKIFPKMGQIFFTSNTSIGTSSENTKCLRFRGILNGKQEMILLCMRFSSILPKISRNSSKESTKI